MIGRNAAIQELARASAEAYAFVHSDAPRCECGATPVLLKEFGGKSEGDPSGTFPSTGRPEPSDLATWFLPRRPKLRESKPDPWAGSFTNAILALVGVFLVFTLWALANLATALAAALLVATGLGFWTHCRRRRDETLKSPVPEISLVLAEHVYEERLRVWERLLYCPGCGEVTDAGTGAREPWHAIPTLLAQVPATNSADA